MAFGDIWISTSLTRYCSICFPTPSNIRRSIKINVSLSAIYKEGCRFLVLNVEDEGIGIAEKDIKHIFTKFYNNKNHPGCQSNGIGLSLTKELVTLHHGIIEVNSELGKGSVFTVEIPIDREVYSEREIAESSP